MEWKQEESMAGLGLRPSGGHRTPENNGFSQCQSVPMHMLLPAAPAMAICLTASVHNHRLFFFSVPGEAVAD